jgi:O-antigen/teichoic acid export membrane protein
MSYNSGMGRLRIKKKEAVIPFRETLAYRMILLTVSAIAFLVAVSLLIGFLGTNTIAAISSGAIAAAAAFGIFFNLERLRQARIPKHTLNRMKRR